MSRNGISFIVGFIVAIIATVFANNRTVEGAKLGGNGISKGAMYKAIFQPEQAARDAMPFSMLIGSIVGLVAFGITYALVPKKQVEERDSSTEKES